MSPSRSCQGLFPVEDEFSYPDLKKNAWFFSRLSHLEKRRSPIAVSFPGSDGPIPTQAWIHSMVQYQNPGHDYMKPS